MQIKAVIERCFDKEIYAIYRSIASDPAPLAILAPGPPEAVALIAGDGSSVIIEHSVLSQDFGTFNLESEVNVLEQIAAAPEIFDMTPGRSLHTVTGDYPIMFAMNDSPTLIYLNPAARLALGFQENDDLEEINTHFRTKGRDATDIVNQITALSESLENPFFIPKDVEDFTYEDVKVVKPILKDILTLLPDLKMGDYKLRAAWPEEEISANLQDEDGNLLPEGCMEIIQMLTDVDKTFRGVVYERVGRGGTRVADFEPEGAVVVMIEIEQQFSQHDRVAAWQRLEKALTAAGHEAGPLLEKISQPK